MSVQSSGTTSCAAGPLLAGSVAMLPSKVHRAGVAAAAMSATRRASSTALSGAGAAATATQSPVGGPAMAAACESYYFAGSSSPSSSVGTCGGGAAGRCVLPELLVDLYGVDCPIGALLFTQLLSTGLSSSLPNEDGTATRSGTAGSAGIENGSGGFLSDYIVSEVVKDQFVVFQHAALVAAASHPLREEGGQDEAGPHVPPDARHASAWLRSVVNALAVRMASAVMRGVLAVPDTSSTTDASSPTQSPPDDPLLPLLAQFIASEMAAEHQRVTSVGTLAIPHAHISKESQRRGIFAVRPEGRQTVGSHAGQVLLVRTAQCEAAVAAAAEGLEGKQLHPFAHAVLPLLTIVVTLSDRPGVAHLLRPYTDARNAFLVGTVPTTAGLPLGGSTSPPTTGLGLGHTTLVPSRSALWLLTGVNGAVAGRAAQEASTGGGEQADDGLLVRESWTASAVRPRRAIRLHRGLCIAHPLCSSPGSHGAATVAVWSSLFFALAQTFNSSSSGSSPSAAVSVFGRSAPLQAFVNGGLRFSAALLDECSSRFAQFEATNSAVAFPTPTSSSHCSPPLLNSLSACLEQQQQHNHRHPPVGHSPRVPFPSFMSSSSDDETARGQFRQEADFAAKEALLRVLDAAGSSGGRSALDQLDTDEHGNPLVPPENVLFVCKLNPQTRAAGLAQCFGQFGAVVGCEIIRDPKTSASLCYGFVEFADAEACNRAFNKMDNALIDFHRIHVDFCQSTTKLQMQNLKRQREARAARRKTTATTTDTSATTEDSRDTRRRGGVSGIAAAVAAAAAATSAAAANTPSDVEPGVKRPRED